MAVPSPPDRPSEATLRALEFPSLLAVVAELGATDLGRRRILALTPYSSEDAYWTSAGGSKSVRALVAGGVLVPSQEEPLRPMLTRLGTGHHGSTGADLVFLASMLRTVRQARERIVAADPPCPKLLEAAQGLPDLEGLETRIHRCLDPRGEIRPDASPRLVQLRQRIHGLRDSLYRSFEDTFRRIGTTSAKKPCPSGADASS